jgi:regulation of enolase protein 1 (concanavalin A-like superfamily)
MRRNSTVLSVRRLLVACVAVLSTSATVGAQTINVTSGYLDMSSRNGLLQLGGERGFSAEGGVSSADGIYQPELCNPNTCVPGGTVNLGAAWSGHNIQGNVATLDGASFAGVGGAGSPNSMRVEFSGTASLPPPPEGGPWVTITAPFTLTGFFRHTVPAGEAVTESLSGTGTAMLFLKYGYAAWPNSYRIDRVLYTFAATLPYPWVSADVGAVGPQGSGTYSNGRFAIQGSGADIWGTADAFQFTAQRFDFGFEDPEIVARVTAVQNTDPFAKAGLMMRGNRDAASPYVILDVKPDGEAEFMTRPAAGVSTMYVAGAVPGLPVWLRLTRRGSIFTGAVSTDGSTWTEVGSATASLPVSRSYGGLAVTSHDATALNQSIFDNVQVIVRGTLPSPWLSGDVGAVGVPGSASYGSSADGNVFYVIGSGADIWDAEDGFHYVYQPISGDGAITVRVTEERNTHPYAKAGVMLRGSLAANAGHVILDVRPGGEVEFMMRSATGSSTTFNAATSVTFPAWLRLTRTGTTVTGEVSPDGTTWATVGSTTLLLESTTTLGLAVTSHETSLQNLAAFDNVDIRIP